MGFFLIAVLLLMYSVAQADTIPFSDGLIPIEFNSTDRDVGVQVFLYDEPWKTVKIVAPNGRTIFEVEGEGRLRNLGLTELFFESEEPLSEFLAMFPEGEYRFIGRTVEGDTLTPTAISRHAIPDGPVILSPKKNEVISPSNATIQWSVTTPAGIQVVRSQVIV